MKQFDLFKDESGREVQLRERLATPLIPNSACEEVTNRMKPEGGSCWAATQVKVLSSEINIVSEADTVHSVEGRMLATDTGEEVSTPTESKSVAWQQRDNEGTRETQYALQNKTGVCDAKPIDGKVMQKAYWESDQPIVARKQGNACGAKGLTVTHREDRDTFSAHRGGHKKSTKLLSLTVRGWDLYPVLKAGICHRRAV